MAYTGLATDSARTSADIEKGIQMQMKASPPSPSSLAPSLRVSGNGSSVPVHLVGYAVGDDVDRVIPQGGTTPAGQRPPCVRGNPGPLGLLGFGMTTCMLMFATTHWTNAGFVPTVIAYAAFYGGLGQFIAGILELIRGSTFAGTAFASYGCFWMGWSMWKILEATATVAAVLSVARTGDTLWCILWGVLTSLFFVVTLRKNICLQYVFSTLLVTFFLLAGANYSVTCGKAAGYIGFFCGAGAIYTAIAEVYRDELGFKMPGLAPVKFI